MSEEIKPNGENGDGWRMPEPVFRSTAGRKPGERPHDPQAEIPTEPGFTDDDPAIEPSSKQGVRAKTGEATPRHRTRKRGCAKTLGTIIGTITVIVLAILAAVIYFLFFYRPVDRSTF